MIKETISSDQEIRLSIVNILASHYVDELGQAGIPSNGGAKFIEMCQAIEQFVLKGKSE